MMPFETTIVMITGLPFPNEQNDQGIKDRNQLAASLVNSFKPFLHVIPLLWEQDTFDLNQITTPKLMLAGHSFGGDSCLTLISNAPSRQIDSLVLLDPVPNNHREHAWDVQHDMNFKFTIPANVTKCTAYRRILLTDVITHPKLVVTEPGRVEQNKIMEMHANFWRNKTTQGKIREELARVVGVPLPAAAMALGMAAPMKRSVSGGTPPKKKSATRARATKKRTAKRVKPKKKAPVKRRTAATKSTTQKKKKKRK